MEREFRWKKSNANEFLSPIDAFLAYEFLLLFEDRMHKVCEIGVWKGAWINSLSLNLPNASIIGVDPYPGLDSIKKEFEENVLRKYKNVSLVASTAEIDDNVLATGFNLIHIDGEHSESAVRKDLEFAYKHLAPGGIIIVDDIWHKSFPGIASATFNFLHNSESSSFLITGAKMYICHKKSFDFYHKESKKILIESKIIFETGFEMGTYGESYAQDNSINGFRQIIMSTNPGNIKSFSDAISQVTRLGRLRRRLKFLLAMVMPAGFIRIWDIVKQKMN